jgi:CRP-like cAMP-binding protein
MKFDRTPSPSGLADGKRVTRIGLGPPRAPSAEDREPIVGLRGRAATREAAGVRPAERSRREFDDDASVGHRVGWSQRRLSAAVSATRCGRRPSSEHPLGDEVEFFSAVGKRREVPAGVALVHRSKQMHEVHLIERGAAAVIGEHRGRRPILAFALRDELCCAVPALLHEPAPWDAVTVTDAAVITVPADVFTAAVHERWVDRWTTRTLLWLAQVGTRVADLDASDPVAQVAAVLLRSKSEVTAELCRSTIADLLDLDDAAVRDIIGRLELVGAVRVSGGRISVIAPEILRATVAGTHRL